MELRDGELLLRPPTESDVPAVVAACQDPEISRFVPLVPSPYGENEARSWLAAVSDGWRETPEKTFAIVDDERDELLGAIAVRLVVDWVAERVGFQRIGTTTSHPPFREGSNEVLVFELS